MKRPIFLSALTQARSSALLVLGASLLQVACYGTDWLSSDSGSAELVTQVDDLSTSDAARFVAEHEDLPGDLLLALGWVSSSFVLEEHETEGSECLPRHGWLGLTDQQVERAGQLTGLDEERIRADRDAGMVAGAALLAALRDEVAPQASGPFLGIQWWPVILAWAEMGEDWLDAEFATEVFDVLQRGLSVETPGGELIQVPARAIPGLQDLPMPVRPSQSEERFGGAADYPGTSHFVSAHSSNQSYRPGGTGAIDSIVIHTVEGSYAGTISWFRNPSSDVSAHYVVRRSDGEVTQMVSDGDKAWHAASYNGRSIGIEHEGHAGTASNWTEPLLESSARLSAWLSDSYGIPVDRTHFLAHSEISPYKSDPGVYFPWDRYLDLVRCFKEVGSTCPEGTDTPVDSGGVPPEDSATPPPGDDGSSGGGAAGGGDGGSGSDDSGPGSDSLDGPRIRILHPTPGLQETSPVEIVASRVGGHAMEFRVGPFLLGSETTANPGVASVDFAVPGPRTVEVRLLSSWGTVLDVDRVTIDLVESSGWIRPFGAPSGGTRWTIGAEFAGLPSVDHVVYTVDGWTLTDDSSGETEIKAPHELVYTFGETGHGRILTARAYSETGEFLADGVAFIDVEESSSLECVVREPLSCGQTVTGDTSADASATDRLHGYPGLPGNFEGPEVGFELSAAGAGEVELTLVGARPMELDHDIILLRRDLGTCVAADFDDVGFNSLVFEPEAGARYTAVVDGYDGDAGPFELRMDCQ